MAYKILEQNGVENENIDGAAFNYAACSGKDGILKGVLNECSIQSTSSNSLQVSSGELVISGFRVKVLDPYIVSFSSTPSSPVNYQIVGRLVLNKDRSVQFQIIHRQAQALIKDPLFVNEEGIYEVELAKFVHNFDGSISDIVRSIRMLPVSYQESADSFVENNIVIFGKDGKAKDSGVSVDLIYPQVSSWADIKKLCKLGVADKFIEAGAQISDKSPKYGDVIFDVVNVTPTEVIIQSHSIIGHHISIGYFEAYGNVWYDLIEVNQPLYAGEVFCIRTDAYYNDELVYEGTIYEWWRVFDDVEGGHISAGTYDYTDLTRYCEQVDEPSDPSLYRVFSWPEMGYDIDDPPAISLVDYAASMNAQMSEDFQQNVGTGFVPNIHQIGGYEFPDCWQYYLSATNPMDSTNSASSLRSKGGDWAFDSLDWGYGIQTVDYSQGAYMANAIDDSGAYTEIWNGACGVAPAFRINRSTGG